MMFVHEIGIPGHILKISVSFGVSLGFWLSSGNIANLFQKYLKSDLNRKQQPTVRQKLRHFWKNTLDSDRGRDRNSDCATATATDCTRL